MAESRHTVINRQLDTVLKITNETNARKLEVNVRPKEEHALLNMQLNTWVLQIQDYKQNKCKAAWSEQRQPREEHTVLKRQLITVSVIPKKQMQDSLKWTEIVEIKTYSHEQVAQHGVHHYKQTNAR